MVQKTAPRRRKKARRKKPVAKMEPTAGEKSLLDFIAHIYDDLDNLKDTLEFLPGCSISELETECWQALGEVKTIMHDIETMGDE